MKDLILIYIILSIKIINMDNDLILINQQVHIVFDLNLKLYSNIGE